MFDLSSLLKDVPDLDTVREQIEYIRLEMLEEDPNNFYQLSEIPELAANIQLCGLQQPIRVRQGENGKYRIVSGHRRRAAVELLAQEDPEKWAKVPCIIETDEASPALQQLRMIFANSNTRVMTPVEISEQATMTKQLLYRLKEEEGYEFPGRIRDHVAQIVGVSKSKLARLDVIRDKLVAAWEPAWKDGTLSESTAYELAKMPADYQDILFEEKSRTSANLNYLYADDVRKFLERALTIDEMECKDSCDICLNSANKIRKAAVADRYGWFHCDGKCCKDCPEWLRCQRACPKLKDVIKHKKAEAKEISKSEAAAKAERDRPAVERISALWQRFGFCREMAHKEVDDCKKALGIYYFPYEEDKVMRLECGEAKISPETKLPFGYSCYLPEISRLIALADLLGVSLDYLLCRTDVREITPEPVPYQGTIWHPITEEPPTGVDLVWLDASGYSDTGMYWGGGDIESVCTIRYDEARWWAELPKED